MKGTHKVRAGLGRSLDFHLSYGIMEMLQSVASTEE